jgi:Ner family transcriptional regulator
MNVINPDTIPLEAEIRREWIKYQLKIRELSIAALARRYGGKRNTAIKVLDRPYPLWEKRIAETLGTEPKLIWPERYDQSGVPNRRRGRPVNSTHIKADIETNSTNAGGRHNKKRTAETCQAHG